MQNGQTINIYSIFRSINGEVCRPGQGSWTTFVRMAGCNLNCGYCDTPYALEADSGEETTIDRVVEWVDSFKCRNVTITGGEPLMQRSGFYYLLKRLHSDRYNVSVETNGSYPIIDHFPIDSISWVVDYKLPSSGQTEHMADVKPWSQLSRYDYIKFVIADRRDYDVALAKVQLFWSEGVEAQIAFSPIMHKLYVNTLKGWMQQNELFQVMISLQLHKLVALEESK